MRLGLALPHYDTSLAGQPARWEDVRRVALRAEAAGLASVWVSDHLFLDWSKYGGPARAQGTLECWTTMSALAAATRSVHVGALVCCNDFRNPALVAKMASSLQVLARGRIEVGLGAGWYEPEYDAAGIGFDRAGVRIERLGEAASVVRRLVAGETVAGAGRHYPIGGASVRPVAERPPPVWIGGKGDKTLDAAARHADGWNFSWVGSLDAYRERARAADAACERVDRDPQSLRRSVGAYVLVGRDGADLERRYRRLIDRTPPGVLRSADGAAGLSWDEFRRDRIAGTVTEVVDRLGSLAELGVEEVIVGLGAIPFQVADEDDVEFLGREVAPALD